MIDKKHAMKLERAFNSFRRVAAELDAVDLLEHVLAEDVERIVYHGPRDREAIARRILLAMRERSGADGN